MLATVSIGPLFGLLAFAFVMCLLPLFASTGTVRVLIFAHFLAMFAMSWDIVSCRAGYISFGHPFLIGPAAYTTSMLTCHLDAPLWLSIPAAVLVTMAGGALFFLPALRIRGTYVPLVTLAFDACAGLPGNCADLPGSASVWGDDGPRERARGDDV